MNYQEFIGSVTGFLRESLPYGTKLERVSLEKNNGVVLDGLAVRRDGQQIAPTIYLDAYYQEYLDGQSLNGIYRDILHCCEEGELPEDFDADFFLDYHRIRPMIVYRLVHRERNRELLKRVPFIPYLDLAIIFSCMLSDSPVGNATIRIDSTHLELWQVTVEDLYEAARENTERLLPAQLRTMSEVIRELSCGLDCPEEDVPMYVLTNRRQMHGAACLLYGEGQLLRACRERLGGGFYVLPSSIHELILVPASVVSDEQMLGTMIREINETQVQPTEVLSDHAYRYMPEYGRLVEVSEE